MKKPAGWLELISKAFGMVAGAAKGGAPGGEGGMKQNLIPIVLVLLVAVAAYFYFARGSSQGSVTCDLLPQYYRPAEWFGFGAKPVKPMLQADSSLRVEGTCSFTNPGTEDISSIIALVKVNANGIAIGQNTSSVALFAPTGRTSTLKDFEIVWPGSTRQKYLFSYCRLEQCR
ncbi:TPA: hypothetical protein HA244_06495 [Candidatus Micrarchaeota archaeon]|nr:hypothetical protein [Candidatus Micrarchaeota archaeon]